MKHIVNLFRVGKAGIVPEVHEKLDDSWQQLLVELKRAEFMATTRNFRPTSFISCSDCDLSIGGAEVFTLVINNTEYHWTELLAHNIEKHKKVELIVYCRMLDMFKDIRQIFEQKETSQLEV